MQLLQNASGPRSTNISHNYISWQNTWKATINPDDYFKFSSKKVSRSYGVIPAAGEHGVVSPHDPGVRLPPACVSPV